MDQKPGYNLEWPYSDALVHLQISTGLKKSSRTVYMAVGLAKQAANHSKYAKPARSVNEMM